VTPKQGVQGRQPRAVAPVLLAVGILCGSAVYGLAGGVTASTLNNVAFVLLHVTVLLGGIWPALVRSRGEAIPDDESIPAADLQLEPQGA